MLQLTTFLTHQNGTIHEGLNLWKRNVDKRFQGVEVGKLGYLCISATVVVVLNVSLHRK